MTRHRRWQWTTEGNVLAAGYTENTGTGRDFTVVKFAPDGTTALAADAQRHRQR
jgi:hypothetical protein